MVDKVIRLLDAGMRRDAPIATHAQAEMFKYLNQSI
ncbi:hypothetical protein Pse7367_0824 [Thalassoporum mexicanum PCC 7367]|nr:hypothetical protein Pse7367_0824 [Pseudanabaena sp. PCC 7367]